MRSEAGQPRGPDQGRSIEFGWRRPIVTFLLLLPVAVCPGVSAAEHGRIFLTETAPFLPFDQDEPARYNLKWGHMTGRLTSGLQFEASDNLGLSDSDSVGDVSLTPQANIGFLWPISQNQVLRFDLGAGYRFYFDNPELNSLYVRPGSALNLQVRIEDVRLELRNEFSVQMDATAERGVGGNAGSVLDFRRFSDTTALDAFWQPNSYTRVGGGYSFSLDRSMSEEFTQLDRDTHAVYLSGSLDIAPRWSAGAYGSFMAFRHLEAVLNNGASFSVGPVLLYEPTEFIEIEAMAGYAWMLFDESGTNPDTSDFAGFTAQCAIRHRLNSRMTQHIQFRDRPEIGYEGNYSEVLAAQYGLEWRLASAVRLNTQFAYEHYTTSGTQGETADRVLWSADTDYRLAPRWSLGLGYSFGVKLSDQVGRDYRQNRVTLEATYAF